MSSDASRAVSRCLERMRQGRRVSERTMRSVLAANGVDWRPFVPHLADERVENRRVAAHILGALGVAGEERWERLRVESDRSVIRELLSGVDGQPECAERLIEICGLDDGTLREMALAALRRGGCSDGLFTLMMRGSGASDGRLLRYLRQLEGNEDGEG